MTNHSRRDVLKGSLAAAAGLAALGIPEWAIPALAQSETVVPFTDLPETLNFVPGPERRLLDIRTIGGPFTPKDQFFTTQHYGHPEVDPAAFRLKITGLVERPKSLSLDDLRRNRSEGLGRRCYVMELEPGYGDGIRRRYAACANSPTSRHR